jgi:RNA polymerase sigma-70 factor (ECF subfamily)
MDDKSQGTAEGLRAGRREAWTQFYEMYSEPLWREVARISGGRTADVADIVQDSFLIAAESARQYDPARGSLWSWLLGIARNRVALHWRKQTVVTESARRWWASRNGQARQWLTGDADAPDEVLQSKELAALVRLALLELSPDHQAALVRKYLDEATSDQIAAECGISPEAVRARLSRARESFRQAFLQVAGGASYAAERNEPNE